jgi:hypothetical protein
VCWADSFSVSSSVSYFISLRSGLCDVIELDNVCTKQNIFIQTKDDGRNEENGRRKHGRTKPRKHFPEIRPFPWSFPSALTGSPPRRASAEVDAKLRRRSERGGLSSDGMLCWSPCCAQVGVLLLKGGWPWSARQFAPDAKGLSQAV